MPATPPAAKPVEPERDPNRIDIGALGFLASYTLIAQQIHAYAGSLMATAPPPGAENGLHGELSAEASWDTRDNEASPTSGAYLALAARGSHPALGSRWTYAGGT